MSTTAKPVGRTVRVVTGVALLGFLGSVLSVVPLRTGILSVGLAFGLLVFYVGLHILVTHRFRDVDPWCGAFLANFPALVVFLVTGVTGQLGAILYVALNMVIAGINADRGCETLTLSSLFGHGTHLPCLAFSPIDALEDRVSDS